MSEERQHDGRAADQGLTAVTLMHAKATGSGFWNWIEKRHIPAHMVIGVTVWLTIRITEWAMDFKMNYPEVTGSEAAFLIGAVTGPWVLLQSAMFKFYCDSVKSNGPT